MQAQHNNRIMLKLWKLADEFDVEGSIAQTIKCLEAICQSQTSLEPLLEAKARIRIANALLSYSNNLKMAQSHLERALVVLKHVPGNLSLKCSTISLLSHCYLLGSLLHAQKQMLIRGLQLARGNLHDVAALTWTSSFTLQLAGAQLVEGDASSALASLAVGKDLGMRCGHAGLQLLFAAPELQVLVMAASSSSAVTSSIQLCRTLESQLTPEQREDHRGLLLYVQLLVATWHLNSCQFQNLSADVALLDGFLEASSSQPPATPPPAPASDSSSRPPDRTRTFPEPSGRLHLGKAPLDVAWLPQAAVVVLVDLLAVASWQASGKHKEASRRLRTSRDRVIGELEKLGVYSATTEADVELWAAADAQIFVHLWVHLLERSTVILLTRTNYYEAQQSLVEMVSAFQRFPQVLGSRHAQLQLLLGQYAHSLGNFQEAVAHFSAARDASADVASKLACDIFSALSHVCGGAPDALSKALDLVGPAYGAQPDDTQSFSERTKIGALFGMGLIRFQQGSHADARLRLAGGLRLAHVHLGSHHILSQFLVPLGGVAARLGDARQAREILRSALTTARVAGCVPAQLASMAELEGVYQSIGEYGALLENQAAMQKKRAQLEDCRLVATNHPSHAQLLQFGI